jgi:hypothetical protein
MGLLGPWDVVDVEMSNSQQHNIVIFFVYTSCPWIIRIEELHDMK